LIVDTSGEALRHAVDEGLYMIKPNLGELSKLAGREELHTGDVVNIARSIIEKGRIELALVSMGAAGAMLVTRAEACILTPPPVIRKSTVGAGDSMVAGMIAGLIQFADPILAARYAVACGTAATLNPGTQLCRKADADRLYTQVMVANM
ncbi:MAG TPA: PfkB family carbohydrate kinase, partial [Ferruginibacter sp.]|nr:PfkB family carbohydrate kinase [Ferruginibacter sp.]